MLTLLLPKSSLLIFLLFSSLCAFNVSAKDSSVQRDGGFLNPDQVHELNLPNGMKFLLVPHGETPIFSAYIRFQVGGLDEPKGMTGAAHLIEHMAFKGTKTWGTKDWAKEQPLLDQIEEVGQAIAAEYAKEKKADAKQLAALNQQLAKLYEQHQVLTTKEELSRTYQVKGGLHLNATTSQDLTSYFVSLPSSELEFWTKTEAERLFAPVFREFYRERDVVLEERRSRVVDSPSGHFFTEMMKAAFEGTPYGRPTIGYQQDLLTLTRTKAEIFFEKYYRPDNAIAVLVGRFDVGRAKKLIKKYFGKVPAVTTAKPIIPSGLQPPIKREGCVVNVTRTAQPRLALLYHKPKLPHRDDYLFDVLATILSEDRSSQLYNELVIKQQLATAISVYASVPGGRLSNAFMVYAVPRPGVELGRLQVAVEQQLNAIKREGVTADQLRKAKKQLITQQVWQLESNQNLAEQLSYFQAILGDWHYLVDYEQKIRSIKREELQTLAVKYFVPGNRCVGRMQSAGGQL